MQKIMQGLGGPAAAGGAPGPGRAWRWCLGGVLMVLLVALWWRAPTPGDPVCPQNSPAAGAGAAACHVLRQAMRPGDGVPVNLPWAAEGPEAAAGLTGEPLVLTLPVQLADPSTPGMGSGRIGVCLLRSPRVVGVQVDARDLPPPDAPISHYMRPLHLRLGVLQGPGPHTLTLALQAPAGLTRGLGPVMVGDDDLTQQVCDGHAYDVRLRLGSIVWVMGLLGVAGLLLWWQLREPEALWFGLMALTWVLHLLHVQGLTPMPERLWAQFYFASRAAFLLPMLLFAFAFAGQPMRRWRLPLVLGYGAALIVLAALPPSAWSAWLRSLGVATLPLALLGLAWLLRGLWQAYSLSRLLMVVAFALIVLAQGLDTARWDTDAGYAGRLWSYVTVPLVCFAFGQQLLERLTAHARREAGDAVRLRREVEAQRVRIAADYERLQHQRERLAVQEERRRIVRDMHDGLGAHLLSASALLKSRPMQPDAVAALFDDALLELRSVLDVLTVEPSTGDPDDDPVSVLLGTLRWRMAPALQARGITLHWQCGALPSAFLPQDAARMHLLRLLQEAFSNILKHSQATDVSLQVSHDEAEGVVLVLKDNGCGFEPGGTGGIGLDSMRARASTIRAELTLDSAPGAGTTLRLRWPPAPAPGESENLQAPARS